MKNIKKIVEFILAKIFARKMQEQYNFTLQLLMLFVYNYGVDSGNGITYWMKKKNIEKHSDLKDTTIRFYPSEEGVLITLIEGGDEE